MYRSLFEPHKLLFAFSMALKLNEDDGTSPDQSSFAKNLKELELLQTDKPAHQGRRNTRSVVQKSDTAS